VATTASVDLRPSTPVEVLKVRVPLLFLCFAVALVDGFDTLAIAFAAPAIAAEWRVPTAALGLLFSSGLLGGLVGAASAPVLAARAGYRNGLIVCVFWFSIGTFAMNWIPSVATLVLLRFLTGIGLGGAMPLLNVAAMEFFPAQFRSRAVAMMLIGMPLGGVLAGGAAALLIPQYGWRSVFLVGCTAPVFIVPFLALMMPRGGSGTRTKSRGIGAWRDLLNGARPVQTALVAIVCFLGMLIAYSLVNWAPTLMQSTSHSFASASFSASLLNVGSAVAMLSYGWLIDRFGLYRVSAVGYLAGAPFLVLIGFAPYLGPAALLIIFIGGLLVLGTPVALPLLAAATYPPHLRVEAISGYVVTARVGAVIGPLIAGVIVAYAGGVPGFFAMLALASAAAGAVVVLLYRQLAQERPK
jgi:MFS transporter, AAHS family, 4-hydroxybenzoate transporter